jgi:trehalose-6-phosphate synthase
LAEQINKKYKDNEKYGKWLPIIFQTSGLQRSELIAHYLAMDVGVVTPKKDGMNLVLFLFVFLIVFKGCKRNDAL